MDPDYVCMVCAFTIEKKTGEGVLQTQPIIFFHTCQITNVKIKKRE